MAHQYRSRAGTHTSHQAPLLVVATQHMHTIVHRQRGGGPHCFEGAQEGGKTAAKSDCVRLPEDPSAPTTAKSSQPPQLQQAKQEHGVYHPVCASQLIRRASRYPARTSTLAHSESSPKQPLPASRSTNWRYRSDQSVTMRSQCMQH